MRFIQISWEEEAEAQHQRKAERNRNHSGGVASCNA